MCVCGCTCMFVTPVQTPCYIFTSTNSSAAFCVHVFECVYVCVNVCSCQQRLKPFLTLNLNVWLTNLFILTFWNTTSSLSSTLMSCAPKTHCFRTTGQGSRTSQLMITLVSYQLHNHRNWDPVNLHNAHAHTAQRWSKWLGCGIFISDWPLFFYMCASVCVCAHTDVSPSSLLSFRAISTLTTRPQPGSTAW